MKRGVAVPPAAVSPHPHQPPPSFQEFFSLDRDFPDRILHIERFRDTIDTASDLMTLSNLAAVFANEPLYTSEYQRVCYRIRQMLSRGS